MKKSRNSGTQESKIMQNALSFKQKAEEITLALIREK